MSEYQLTELLDKHEKGICNEQEQLILQRYFDSFQDGQEIWNELGTESKLRLKQQTLAHINQHIDHEIRTKARKNRNIYWRVAAAVLLITAVSLVSIYFNQPTEMAQPRVAIITKSAARGQKLTLRLTDGSTIRLNSESTVTFPETFSGTREIKLTGEAFFEVSKSEKPFRVITGDLTTTVKGTSFNVKADNSEQTEVTVATGLVEVSDGDQTQLLNPGEQAMYSLEDKKLIATQVDLEKHLAWKEGVLLFEGNTLKEVTDRLSRWYDVSFEYVDEGNDSCDLKLTFDNRPLTDVLERLKLVTGIDYEFKSAKEIEIFGTGCIN